MTAPSTPATTAVPIIRGAGEGERRWFYGGGLHIWKATAAETGGAFLMFEDEMEQGKVTPLHIHPDADETLYMLEGEILMHVDGEEHRVGTGGVAMAPRGVPHAFLVLSATARLLAVLTPGIGEEFYRGASEPITGDGPGSGVVDFERIMASAQDNGGIVVIGPPPFDRS